MKIGLDAGHGLNTAGKRTPDGIKEWEINDKVRDKEVEILKDYDCEIIYTDNDEGNVDESLTSRRAMYVNQNVDAFVSNHHNALDGKWGNHKGVEVYVDKNATEEDLRLAKLIYDKLVKYTGLKGRGIKRADFTIINQNQIPAVLVEGGFMDSKIDYPVITSKEGQNAYARAVAEGLIEFLGLTKIEQPDLECNSHIENVGWTGYKDTSKEIIGTEGQGKRLEAIQFKANNGLDIQYRVHIENIGWQDWKNNGEVAGTEGQSLRIEAIEIKCNKELEVEEHIQEVGWMPNSKGREILIGTVGKSLRLEAFKIKVL